ncbi:type II toxin-antitoxin system PemK/MazF family toxin [Reichenbachiella sp. MSK19-1]|uniref:type II toxin-antitoxin system PemK/MazF family toxin n=1 Tax=Reichenbachiella sp. MSK19-1 TaxID=1897631 RepID=UPI000E6BB9F7|nr:type II toxin-antitoxin system PemK/MazF family toxin [Reichenbachiella sp. MSK19-1]RJE74446.1 taxon MazF [Reichenbachiella sp. MSK19-1]
MPRPFEIWLTDLNPLRSTEPGKVRPVMIVQSNLLNEVHLSTLVCPMTTHLVDDAKVLRVRVPTVLSGLDTDFDVLIDQIRAIDNRRLLQKPRDLPMDLKNVVRFNLKVVLDLDW